MRGWILLALLSTTAWSAEPGNLVPLVRQPTGATPDRVVMLRHNQRYQVYAPTAGDTLKLVLCYRQIGGYTDPVSAWIDGIEATKVTVGRAAAGLPQTAELTYQAPHAGSYDVLTDAGLNAGELRPTVETPWLTLAASPGNPLALIGYAGKLYFYVPRGCAEFSVNGHGASTVETLRLTVFDAEGEQRAVADSLRREVAAARVIVPAGQDGKVWWFECGKVPEAEGTFEDCTVWLSPEVPQVLAVRSDGLLVPFVHGLVARPQLRNGRAWTVSLQLNCEPLAGEKLFGRVTDGKRVIAEGDAAADQTVTLRVPGDMAAGHYQAQAELRGPDGIRARDQQPLDLSSGVSYLGGTQPLLSLMLPASTTAPPVRIRHNLGGRVPQLKGDLRLVQTMAWETPGEPLGKVVWETHLGSLPADAVEYAAPPNLSDGHYQWQLGATGEKGELLDRVTGNFLLKDAVLFTQLNPEPPPPMPVVTAAQQRGGVVCFVPDGTDGIACNARPTETTQGQLLKLFGTPGERVSGTIGIWSPNGVKHLVATVSGLVGETTLPAETIDLRYARFWPQRISWRSTTYKIVPELLDRPAPQDLEPDGTRQAWLTIHLPDETPAGTYRGMVTLQADGCEEVTQPFEVEVLPFKLQTPPGHHWGLYSDSGRWNGYSEAKVKAELADIKAHGLTTLMVYPLAHSKVEWVDGRLEIDSAEFEQTMDWAVEAGLGAPWVMSLQPLPGLARKLSGKESDDPAYEKVWKDVTQHFVDLAERKQWGRCTWHCVDEPWRPDDLRQAALLLGYFKALGLETFTTAGPVPPELDRVLDDRCYALGYLLAKPDQLAAAGAATRESGDQLWYYGSGCYTGQDGNAQANRWVTGPLYWLSGAVGEWSWTFVRPKGDPFDDFDGAQSREPKDACIAYPSPGDEAPLPTLQWEGIRQGIDDYRYLWTLQELARQADRGKREAAEQVLGELRREMHQAWVDRQVTAAAMDTWRRRAAAAILALQ